MKRGEIYFNKYTDSMGKARKIPVVVVSNDEYNAQSDFATCVRMVKEVNGVQRPTHVPVPKDAMGISDPLVEMSDGVALAETISSVRKANMVGPIGEMKDENLMREITEAIRGHVGDMWEGKTKKKEPDVMTSAERPTKQCPWYSPQVEKEQGIGPYGKSSVQIAREHDLPEKADAGSKRFGPGAEG